jgi:hypothetical protein
VLVNCAKFAAPQHGTVNALSHSVQYGTHYLGNTALHVGLRLLNCLRMQAVMPGMFGISLLQSRKASGLQALCCSAVNAKLAVAQVVNETATAKVQAMLRKDV